MGPGKEGGKGVGFRGWCNKKAGGGAGWMDGTREGNGLVGIFQGQPLLKVEHKEV